MPSQTGGSAISLRDVVWLMTGRLRRKMRIPVRLRFGHCSAAALSLCLVLVATTLIIRDSELLSTIKAYAFASTTATADPQRLSINACIDIMTRPLRLLCVSVGTRAALIFVGSEGSRGRYAAEEVASVFAYCALAVRAGGPQVPFDQQPKRHSRNACATACGLRVQGDSLAGKRRRGCWNSSIREFTVSVRC